MSGHGTTFTKHFQLTTRDVKCASLDGEGNYAFPLSVSHSLMNEKGQEELKRQNFHLLHRIAIGILYWAWVENERVRILKMTADIVICGGENSKSHFC